MFGKGGGALGSWIKEFCQLVFIQTIQAFIYAVIIAMITHIQIENVNSENQGNVLGLLSVVCLTSVFKVEDMIKKMVGFGPTKADHGDSVKSIAKTALAAKVGKRVLDNGKKVTGGLTHAIRANNDVRKASNRLNRLKNSNSNNEDENGRGQGVLGAAENGLTTEKPTQRKIDSQKRDEKIRLFNEAQRARKLAQATTDENKRKALIAEAKKKLQQSRAIDDTLKGSATASRTTSAASGGSGSLSVSGSTGGSSSGTAAYGQKMKDLEEQYRADLKKARRERRQGLQTMASGALETAGSLIGGTAGAVLGFADGNIDEGLQGMVGGAGAGDAVAEFAANSAFGPINAVSDGAEAIGEAVRNYQSNREKELASQREGAISELNSMNKSAQSQITKMNKQMDKAHADLEKEVSSAVSRTVKGIEKTSKSSSRPYKSKHGGIKQLDTGLKDLQKQVDTSTRSIKLDNSVESID